VFEALDGWIRRKRRCMLWRQWKRTYTRAKNLMKRGLGKERAFKSATNGRGPWWNAGASHMNEAFPNASLIDLVSCLCFLICDNFNILHEPPCTEPYARWCERTGFARTPPTRFD